MNPKNFLLCLVAFIAFASCTQKKEKDTTKQTDTRQTSANPVRDFREGLANLNDHDQRMIFDNLPGEIKVALWKDRLDEGLEMDLTDQQKQLVREIKDQLTPDMYDSKKNTGFMSYGAEWYSKAKAAFAKADTAKLQNIFMNLGKPNNAKGILQQPAIPDCDCVLAGAWGNCPLNFTCRVRNCTINRCGIFWAWRCDGLCVWNP